MFVLASIVALASLAGIIARFFVPFTGQEIVDYADTTNTQNTTLSTVVVSEKVTFWGTCSLNDLRVEGEEHLAHKVVILTGYAPCDYTVAPTQFYNYTTSSHSMARHYALVSEKCGRLTTQSLQDYIKIRDTETAIFNGFYRSLSDFEKGVLIISTWLVKWDGRTKEESVELASDIMLALEGVNVTPRPSHNVHNSRTQADTVVS